MCGIAGIVGEFDKTSGECSIKRMLAVIEHRGPDSQGFWVKDGFAFGMQRLSIIDIACGNQPIWDQESGVGIVFNGEVYNFKKLRKLLEEKGVVFYTHSDTEVILQLYLQKGMQAVHDLEGMFGVCIYDPRIAKMFLVRDRLGVKPLYFIQSGENFIFGSEIKSILEVLPKRPEISKDSLWHYLTLRYVPSPETIWDGIVKLEPGHFLEYDLIQKKFTITKYWELNFKSEKIQKNRNYEQEFETLFLEAVEKRLLASDVPVGILLSGGLDSSCVAAAATELGHKNFHTFSIGFEDGGQFSELDYAEKVSKYIGSEHHEIVVGQEEFIKFLDDFVWYSDEPIADLASIPLYFVSKLASEYVKVVLSGEGADETLAGYNLDRHAQKLDYLKTLNYLPASFLKHLPFNSTRILAQFGFTNFYKESVPHITNVFSEEEKRKICLFNSQSSTISYLKELYSKAQSRNPIDQLQQVYCQGWLVEDLLMKADKMSMATSLELRVPFLDHKLVEWCASLPLEWKVGSLLKGFTTKRILRSFAQKRIPTEIINRPKQGFPVPAYQWLQSNLLDFATKMLMNKQMDMYCDKSHRLMLIEKLKQGDSAVSHKVWNLIILSKWLEKWTA